MLINIKKSKIYNFYERNLQIFIWFKQILLYFIIKKQILY